jgi:ABC-type transport system substrate-binding protein
VAGILTDREGGTLARRSGLLRVGVLLVLVALALVAFALGGGRGSPAAPAPGRGEVRILGTEPASLDPAAQADITGAAVAAQLFEGLTAFDASLALQPALARSWEVGDDGRRVVFHLRPGLRFSDGTPLTGADVVRSWLRVIDPRRPSPLASLLSDVVGADDYRTGRIRDASGVGLSATASTVTVRLRSPVADFPAIVAAGRLLSCRPGSTTARRWPPAGSLAVAAMFSPVSGART